MRYLFKSCCPSQNGIYFVYTCGGKKHAAYWDSKGSCWVLGPQIKDAHRKSESLFLSHELKQVNEWEEWNDNEL